MIKTKPNKIKLPYYVPGNPNNVFGRWVTYGLVIGLANRVYFGVAPEIQYTMTHLAGLIMYGLRIVHGNAGDVPKMNWKDKTKRIAGYECGVAIANIDRIVNNMIEYWPAIQEGIEQIIR